MPVAVHENAFLAASPAPRVHGSQPPPPATRGGITSFSPASRRRLQRLLSTVEWSKLPPCSFATLTFHRVPDDWHRIFNVWLQGLRRAGVPYLWRLEPQRRGAPHWHVMLWAEPAVVAAARAHWHRLASLGSRAHKLYGFHIRALDSYRAAAAYVSKYVAKLSPVTSLLLAGHRHWGASRGLPCAPQLVGACTSPEYAQLRRAARRLMRARNRTRRVRISPARFHLFCLPQTAQELCRWAGVTLTPPPPPLPPPPEIPPGGVPRTQIPDPMRVSGPWWKQPYWSATAP